MHSRPYARILYFAVIIALMSLCLLLAGVSSCQSGDADGDGYSTEEGDCDDSDASVHPGAQEACDGRDNDCDHNIDDGVQTPYFPDRDGDGYGSSVGELEACSAPTGYVDNGADCDDLDATTHPGAVELCDGKDNDCDPNTDDTRLWYLDADRDEYGTGQTTVACGQPAGYAPVDGDCNDADPTVHPGALETCNGHDDNCDGVIDNELVHYYRDADGDGFGSEADTACSPETGYVEARGDCNDLDSSVHPGADDPVGDSIDQDCGGEDGAQPHLGYALSHFASIQAALDAALPGDIVWVGPGVYLEHDLSFKGKAVALEASHFAEATTIDARSGGRVFSFQGEQEDTVLDGFTLTHGSLFGASGGGIYLKNADPVLRNLVITANKVSSQTSYNGQGTSKVAGGAGIALDGSSPLIENCSFSANTAKSDLYDYTYCQGCSYACTCADHSEYEPALGGALYMTGSRPVITGCDFQGNTATHGGALYVTGSSPSISGSVFTGNKADGTWVQEVCGGMDGCGWERQYYGLGGAVYAEKSGGSLTGSTLWKNTAGQGGGLYVLETGPALSNLRITQNSALIGGGLSLSNVTPSSTFSDLMVTQNTARTGGGLAATGLTATLEHSTFAGNSATGIDDTRGGGLYLSGGGCALRNCLIQDNRAEGSLGKGGGVFVDAAGVTLSQTDVVANSATLSGGGIYAWAGYYNSPDYLTIVDSIMAYNSGYNLWNEPGYPLSLKLTFSDLFASRGPNYNLTSLDSSDLTVDPSFVRLFNDGDWTNDDLHLEPASPLIDGGDPKNVESDGSRADIGLYGGQTDMSYYTDVDGDGLYDGWELANGLDVTSDDSLEDADGDGLTNAQELADHTDPNQIDTDGDGYTDSQEVAAGSNPLDPLSGPVPIVLRVPEDYSTIQAAINAIPEAGTIDVGPGVWRERLNITWIDVTLRSRSGSAATILDAQKGGTALTATGGRLELSGFTLQNGAASKGAGLFLRDVTGALSDLVVTGNAASEWGGGAYLESSTPSITGCTFKSNSAVTRGGGLYLTGSDPAMSTITVTGNTVSGSSPYGNTALGGGLYLEKSHPTIASSEISGNQVTAGARASVSNDNCGYSLPDCDYENYQALARGAGLYLDLSNPVLSDTLVTSNTASTSGSAYLGPGNASGQANVQLFSEGGGLYLTASSPTLTRCTVTGNAVNGASSAEEYGYASAVARGAALALVSGSAPVITDSAMASNSASGSADATPDSSCYCVPSATALAEGGALYVTGSAPKLTRATLTGNTVTVIQKTAGKMTGRGGAVSMDSASTPTFSNSLLADNRVLPEGNGGAIYSNGSSPALIQTTLAGNRASRGGGLYLTNGGAPSISSSILAFNTGGNLLAGTVGVSVAYSDLFNAYGMNHDLAALGSSNRTVDPGFVVYANNGVADDDYRLGAASSLKDAGVPGASDPDGSPAEWGAFGGPAADVAYYQDLDRDGMYDGWELAHGLEPATNDAGADPDADGLTNARELAAHTDPKKADCDGDGASDGAEISGGRNPRDWYSRPGTTGIATAKVPRDFATLQAAIDAAAADGQIDIDPGTYDANVRIESKGLTVTGLAGEAATVLDGKAAGSVVYAVDARLELSGVTLKGGLANAGGGAALYLTSGSLTDLVISGNTASAGGGLYLYGSSPSIAQVQVTGNQMPEYGDGAGIYLEASDPSISNCRIMANGGTYTYYPVSGAGLYLNSSDPRIEASIIANNIGMSGAGLYLNASSPTVVGCVITGNSGADYSSGVEVARGSAPVITGSILAYNTGNVHVESGAPVLTWNDLYAAAGSVNTNLPSIDPSNLTVEPKFLSYDAKGLPTDFHLAKDSPLVNAGDLGVPDPDGSWQDLGAYGGQAGDAWDLDGDGYNDWFWPGTINDAPAGYSAAGWDCDDGNGGLHGCVN